MKYLVLDEEDRLLEGKFQYTDHLQAIYAMSLVHDHNQISKTNLQEKVVGKVEVEFSHKSTLTSEHTKYFYLIEMT